ncbi:MAG: 2-dehydropantoate 2-reductase [Chloroflexi bacterium]|nr:2-dehydropantoate 2-reductase [Chloroflexota bacterium]
MRILVVGAGGIGGWIGGGLQRAGAGVSFVARGAHLAALRRHGLRLERGTGSEVVAPVVASDDPAALGSADVVLLAVKTYSLAAALAALAPVLTHETVVVTLQNGIEAPERAAAAVGRAAVLAGVAYCELTLSAPGIVTSSAAPVRIVCGPLEPGGVAARRVAELCAWLGRAGMAAQHSPDISVELWRKAIFTSGMSGVSTLRRSALGPLLADPAGLAQVTAVMHEAHAIACACGVRFADDPVQAALTLAQRFPADARSSMLRDRERGAPLEVDALNGALVRLGMTLGVATPANQALVAALGAGGSS